MSRMLAALDEMNVSHTVVTSGESFAKFNSDADNHDPVRTRPYISILLPALYSI